MGTPGIGQGHPEDVGQDYPEAAVRSNTPSPPLKCSACRPRRQLGYIAAGLVEDLIRRRAQRAKLFIDGGRDG